MADLGTPDLIGPLIGWRAWGIERIDTVVRLRSLVFGEALWPPQQYLLATCPDEGPDHLVPNEDCTCGIYAASDRATLLEMGYRGTRRAISRCSAK